MGIQDRFKSQRLDQLIATSERILTHCYEQQAESRSSHIRHEDHHTEILWAWLV